jgi:hypothetical protein
MKFINSSSHDRLLNFLEAVDEISFASDLDLVEEKLLNYVFIQIYKGSSVFVGDVVTLKRYGSQVTLHSRIKNLVIKGYLLLQEDASDKRKKLLVPTSKTNDHYKTLYSSFKTVS